MNRDDRQAKPEIPQRACPSTSGRAGKHLRARARWTQPADDATRGSPGSPAGGRHGAGRAACGAEIARTRKEGHRIVNRQARPSGAQCFRDPHYLGELIQSLLLQSHQACAPHEFLRRAAETLLESSGCDALEIRLSEAGKVRRCRASLEEDRGLRFDCRPAGEVVPDGSWTGEAEVPVIERILDAMLAGRFAAAAPFITPRGSFWTGDVERPILLRTSARGTLLEAVVIGGEFPSLVLVPFPAPERAGGVLLLASRERDYFAREDVLFLEIAAVALGIAIAHQESQWALQERVKELSCLYAIARATQRLHRPIDAVLTEVVELLPAGWQYPEIASARITLGDRTFTTPNFAEGPQRQAADVVVGGERKGTVEVFYAQPRPVMDAGPFLAEERSLIDEIARQVGFVLDRRDDEEEKVRLQEQLRHADRLATIGQLAAGTAHELNEPLGSILGFAELIKNSQRMSKQTRSDLDKIIEAALHAREIIRKLMIFSRQMPTQKASVRLNDLVEKGLAFLEPRCLKEGIRLKREIDRDLPEIVGDASQLHQVLVNLVVNAIQAMPEGGTLTVRTSDRNGEVVLAVEDTGIGMSDEVLKQIFVPFFTTKQAGHGTGLGLAVVHGIVTAHGGTIEVESKVGEGTRFEVRLPAGAAPQVGERVNHGSESGRRATPGRR